MSCLKTGSDTSYSIFQCKIQVYSSFQSSSRLASRLPGCWRRKLTSGRTAVWWQGISSTEKPACTHAWSSKKKHSNPTSPCHLHPPKSCCNKSHQHNILIYLEVNVNGKRCAVHRGVEGKDTHHRYLKNLLQLSTATHSVIQMRDISAHLHAVLTHIALPIKIFHSASKSPWLAKQPLMTLKQ